MAKLSCSKYLNLARQAQLAALRLESCGCSNEYCVVAGRSIEMFMKAVILSKTAIGDNKHVFQSHNLIQLHYRTVHIGGIRISQAIVVDIKNIYPKLAYEGDFMFIATPANERQFSRALEHISGVVEYYFEHNRAGVVEPKYQ